MKTHVTSLAHIHVQCAIVLDWPMRDVTSVPLQALRELVRHLDKKLADDITSMIQSGDYIVGERKP